MDRITVFDKDLFLFIPVITTLEGKVCPYTVINGKFTRLVTAYYSIQSDLMETQAMIIYLNDNPAAPGIVKASMFKAFIIQYAKCFSQAWGRNVTLKADEVFGTQTELLEKHEEVMQMRNNYIAHAGQGKYEYGAMVIYLNPESERPAIKGIIHADLKFMDHSLKLPGYERICKHALEYVSNKLNQLQSPYDKEVDSMEFTDLYKVSKTPDRKEWQIRQYGDMKEARDPRSFKVNKGEWIIR